MRTLFLASRELSYQRVDVLCRAFRRLGDIKIVGYTRQGSLIKRSIQVSHKAIPYLASGQFDLVFVGFYGHFIMLPIGLLSRQPVLFDAFLSTYDTLCFDRRQFRPASLAGRAAFKLDQVACRLANGVILDTEHHKTYFRETFGLRENKLHALPVGCNEDLFFPMHNTGVDDEFTVLYYCSYLPLHGAEIVIEAAQSLSDLPIKFRMVGQGPQYQLARQSAEQFRLKNIEFLPFVPLQQLRDEIASAHLCLGGHFGASEKAGRVIPGKIYQILAMAKPLIAGDTPANRELLTQYKTAWLCQPGDPCALAAAIKGLYFDRPLREGLGIAGRQLYEKMCSEKIITDSLNQIIRTLKTN